MPLCASLVHSARHDAAWSACSRPAQRGDLLCAPHRDALNGLVMGILESNFLAYVHQQRQAAREGRALTDRKFCRVDFLAPEPVIHPAKSSRRKRKRRPRAGTKRESSRAAEATAS